MNHHPSPSAGLLCAFALAASSLLGCSSTEDGTLLVGARPPPADVAETPDAVTSDRALPDVPVAPVDAGSPPVDASSPTDVAPPPPPPPTDAGAPVDASTAVSGLPCDVTMVLAAWCTPCHSNPPRHDATSALLTRADFAAPSMADPMQNRGQISVARMQDPMNPMPPTGPRVPADQLAIVQRWVAAGMPAGPATCGSGMPDPLNAAPRCTSNLTWLFGNTLNDVMNPGETCIACHAMRRGPTYQIAGTIYPSGHEPRLCIPPINASAGARVEITDAAGRVTNITPNLVGNFHWAGTLALPYTARVVDAMGRQRRMIAPQRNGDCNACHTAAGLMDAPGRITMPAP